MQYKKNNINIMKKIRIINNRQKMAKKGTKINKVAQKRALNKYCMKILHNRPCKWRKKILIGKICSIRMHQKN